MVAPDYRLAPENRHPIPVLDCYAALKWLHDSASDLDIDPNAIALFGGSAGGGLAAAVALMARDEGCRPIRHQCLLYPMLDDRTASTVLVDPFVGEYVWTREDNAFGWQALLGQRPGSDDISSYAAPARALSLEGLPPTYIWIGALDLFLDERIQYARRLLQAGVPTELHVFPGVTHGNILVADAPGTMICKESVLRNLRAELTATRCLPVALRGQSAS